MPFEDFEDSPLFTYGPEEDSFGNLLWLLLAVLFILLCLATYIIDRYNNELEVQQKSKVQMEKVWTRVVEKIAQENGDDTNVKNKKMMDEISFLTYYDKFAGNDDTCYAFSKIDKNRFISVFVNPHKPAVFFFNGTVAECCLKHPYELKQREVLATYQIWREMIVEEGAPVNYVSRSKAFVYHFNGVDSLIRHKINTLRRIDDESEFRVIHPDYELFFDPECTEMIREIQIFVDVALHLSANTAKLNKLWSESKLKHWSLQERCETLDEDFDRVFHVSSAPHGFLRPGENTGILVDLSEDGQNIDLF